MIERKQIGPTENYKGHQITAHYIGPDCICRVDGHDVGNFYVTAEAARLAGRKHVDELEKEGE